MRITGQIAPRQRGEHSGGRGLNRKVEGARRALHIYTLRRDGEGFTNTYI